MKNFQNHHLYTKRITFLRWGFSLLTALIALRMKRKPFKWFKI